MLKVAISSLSSSTPPHENVIFTAGAGVNWDTLVAQTVDANCAGLECLSGIPGTVGGTPVQNVGAYGQEVSETIREVRVLDLQTLASSDPLERGVRFHLSRQHLQYDGA